MSTEYVINSFCSLSRIMKSKEVLNNFMEQFKQGFTPVLIKSGENYYHHLIVASRSTTVPSLACKPVLFYSPLADYHAGYLCVLMLCKS